MRILRWLAAAGLMGWAGPAWGQDVVSEWGSAQVPGAPAVQPVSLDAAHTALLVLDFSGPCAARPRCVATIPDEETLIGQARAAGVMVVYSEVTGELASALPQGLAPGPGDVVVRSGPDKFVGTALADVLEGHAIDSVIVTGTAAEGAVLDTALDAGLREGLEVVVPVDLISSNTLYAEQYVVWDLTHAPGIAARVVLTRRGMVGF